MLYSFVSINLYSLSQQKDFSVNVFPKKHHPPFPQRATFIQTYSWKTDFISLKIIRFPLQRLTLVCQNSNLCRKAGNLASPWKRLIGQSRWVSFYKFETYIKIRDIICLFMLIWKMFPDKHGSGISKLHPNASQECIIEENSTFLNNGRLSLLDQEVHSSQTACVLNLSASSRQRQQQ